VKKKSGCGVLQTLIGVLTLFIWSRSLVAAPESTLESGRIAAFLAGLFGWDPEAGWLSVLVRKTAHFAEFGLLGTLWGGYHCLRPRRGVWLYGLGVAAVDECLQFFAPGRSPQLSDVALDYAGYLCGAAAVWLIALLIKCKKQEK